MGLSSFDESTAINHAAILDAAATTTLQPLVFANYRQVRIDSITAVNLDVIDHLIRITVANSGGPDWDLGVVPIAAGAGYTTGPPIDILLYLLPQNPYLVLDSAGTIQAALQEVATLTNYVTVFAFGGLV